MPALFDQGFFVREPAWHGLGVVLQDYPGREEAMRLAGHDWDVLESEVRFGLMTPDGPIGRGLLAYGQSGDPRSPHHEDGTRAFASGDLRPLRFTDEQIAADPELSTLTLRSDDQW